VQLRRGQRLRRLERLDELVEEQLERSDHVVER
jgi:hypothetical protein